MPRRADPAAPRKPMARPVARPAARPERVAAFRLGLSAESRAAMLLLAKGYRIAARRWKTPVGEIDIVARRGRDLVFVEVKARDTLDLAAESISQRSQRRIIAAAEYWMAQHPGDVDCFGRFDVILVAPGKLPRHIINAFDASQ